MNSPSFLCSASNSSEMTRGVKPSSERKTILIVDDDYVNQRLLLQILKPHFEILLASNGEMALALADSDTPPDLILLDIIMPEMDGYEVCRKLKENPRTRDIPVIFVTAQGGVEDETAGLDMGGVDYIIKPFNLSRVVARVNVQMKLKRQRDELEEITKRLEVLNQMKNKFLGMAVHDLRNPLVSVRGLSELLLSEDFDPLTDTQRLYLQTICAASQEMLSLVNDLLDVSVIESGNLVLSSERASFNRLIRKKVVMNEVAARKKGITIRTAMDEELEGYFDSKRIGQVVDNLMSNAIKYSPPDSNIYISLGAVEGGVRIGVRDEGPGISEEDHCKLFGEFQKLSSKPTAGEKSTGLGLAIVKKIVEAHSGTLEVHSRPGEGSTFSFTIPVGNA